MLTSQPSLLHAVFVFLLHGFALFATFGGCANVTHYLINQFILGDIEYLTQPVLLVLIALCVSAATGLSIGILYSAIQAQRDAMKRLHLVWQPDNTLKLSAARNSRLPAALRQLLYKGDPSPFTLTCKLAHGSYNSHWFVVLAVQPINSQCDGRLFHLVFARDALNDRSFRYLRLWLRARL